MAHLVASRSYVSYTPMQLKRKLEENPYTFIHIINPEFGNKKKSKANSAQRFEKVRKRYEDFIKNGFLVKNTQKAYYLYQQESELGIFKGLICGISIDDYLQGSIRIHEHTLTEREEVFCNYLDICNFNAEPVLLSYKENTAEIQSQLAALSSQRPLLDFSTTDGCRHRLWEIADAHSQESIANTFAKIDTMYIADGHHRTASSALLGKRRRAARSTEESPGSDFILAMLMPAEQLVIKPFHRLISLKEGLKEQELLQKLSEDFILERSSTPVVPSAKRTWGMRIAGAWYALRLRKMPQAAAIKEQLDAVILTEKVLEPVFGIRDQKTDPRINFIPGTESLHPYEKAIDAGDHSALFTLYRVDTEELFAVADANEVMPPKSTWVAPKLRSGLVVMPLD